MRALQRTRSALGASVAVVVAACGPALAVEVVRPVPSAAAAPPPAAAAAATVVASAEPAKPASPAGATRGELLVTVDRAKVIRLPENVQTVILGNPSIADLAVQKNGLAVLTGKSYGVTNLIALDAAGAMLAESVVSVVAPNESLVTVQRGLERQSLSCTPSCQPSVVLGDALPYFSDVKGQADQHRQFSTQR